MPTYFGSKYYPGKYSPLNSPLRPPTPVVNPRGDLRGRNTPRSNNLSQRIPSPTRYSNILDGRTGQLMPYRPGTSLPGYNPANRTRGELNALARGAARRLGLAVRNINPVLRFAFDAYDIYEAFKEPYYKFGPDNNPTEPYEFPGWELIQQCTYATDCDRGPLGIDVNRTCARINTLAPTPPPVTATAFSLTANYKYLSLGVCKVNTITPRAVYYRYRKVTGGTYPPPTSLPGPVRAPVGVIPASIPAPAAISDDVPGRDPSPYEPPVPRYAVPSIDIDIAPGNSSHIPPRNGIHVRRPPRPNEKEKKRGIPFPKALGAIAALYDATTEAQEIVDIFYDRLGRKCRGAKSMSEKAYCVYANLDTLDIDGAVGDLILNHYEDKAWGKFHSYAKKAPFGVSLTGGKPYYSIDIP